MAGKGKLYGVGVGPGDPELLTLKAARIIENADCIAAPNTGGRRRVALDIVADHLHGQEIVDCSTPMTKDASVLERAHDEVAERIATKLDQGKTVAMITLGDPCVYSTFFYVFDRLKPRGYDIEIVPGVTSFCAAAAKLQTPLCEGDESLLVSSISGGNVDEALDVPANKVLMKPSKDLGPLRESLRAHGQDTQAALVTDVGMPGEQVFPHLADVAEPTGYFSLVIVRPPRH